MTSVKYLLGNNEIVDTLEEAQKSGFPYKVVYGDIVKAINRSPQTLNRIQFFKDQAKK